MLFKTKSIIVFIFSMISFILTLQFSQLNNLLIQPVMNSEKFIAQYPYVEFNGLIIQQPSSTFLIQLLCVITVGLGL